MPSTTRTAPGGVHERRREIRQRLTVRRCRGIEVHEATDALGRAIRDPGDHHAAVAVTDEDHVAQIVVVHDGDDVVDVGVEVDAGVQHVRAFAEAGQRRCVHVVPRVAQQPGDALVAPAAVRAAVDENVRRHQSDRIETPAVPGAP